MYPQISSQNSAERSSPWDTKTKGMTTCKLENSRQIHSPPPLPFANKETTLVKAIKKQKTDRHHTTVVVYYLVFYGKSPVSGLLGFLGFLDLLLLLPTSAQFLNLLLEPVDLIPCHSPVPARGSRPDAPLDFLEAGWWCFRSVPLLA